MTIAHVVPGVASSAAQNLLIDAVNALVDAVDDIVTNSIPGIINTVGVPSNAVGVNGQFAIDMTAFTIYGPKGGGAWPAGVDFRGAPARALIQRAPNAAGYVFDASTNPTPTTMVDFPSLTITDTFDGTPLRLVFQATSVTNSVSNVPAAKLGGIGFFYDGTIISPAGTKVAGIPAAVQTDVDQFADDAGVGGYPIVVMPAPQGDVVVPHTPSPGTHTYKIMAKRQGSANILTFGALNGMAAELRIELD